MSSDAMSCAEAEPLLPLVADGAVTPDSDAQLFAHLASCADCQRAVASHDLIALAIARAPQVAPRPRVTVLRWWPYAAAAGLAIALSGMWLIEARPDQAPATTIAAPIPPRAAPPPAIEPAAREVIAVPRNDGSVLYLVRQGEAWVAVDPANPDGPIQPAEHSRADVPVRY